MSTQDPVLSDETDTPTPFSTGALFLGAIVLGAVLGLSLPNGAEQFSQGIDLTLLFMIFLIFFELRFDAVLRAFGHVRFLAIAWSANFLIMPVIGLGIASLFLPIEQLLFVGLMIYFLAPCTDWFLGFTRLAKGDTELGAALIPINMISQLLLFPFWLWLLTKDAGLVAFDAIPNMLLEWFIIPLLAAQAARLAIERTASTRWADRLLTWSGILMPLVLAVLIVQIFATHILSITAEPVIFAMVVAAVCLFFAATLIAGEGLSRLGGLTYPQQALLSMTMAARNAPLMLAFTALVMPDQPLVLAVIVSAMLIEIPLLTVLKRWLLRRNT
ncbi:MAG: arsenic resistance protein [Pseudomonadota bacterium]